MSNSSELSIRLRKAGVREVARAKSWLAEVSEIADPLPYLASAADPDMALLGFVRLGEAAPKQLRACLTGAGNALFSVLGLSQALTDHLLTHPQDLQQLANLRMPPLFSNFDEGNYDPASEEREARAWTQQFLAEFQAADSSDRVRYLYRRALTLIAAMDLSSGAALDIVSFVSRCITALVDMTLQASLRIAVEEADPNHEVRFAVIVMGKTGGREVNYISDVDVIFVVEPARQMPEGELIEKSAKIVSALTSICVGQGQEMPLWPLDMGLRPEGADGAVARTIDSYRSYYRRWAQSWEFQALLKARFAAGDRKLGEEFIKMVEPMVWEASGREGFVADARAMRARVEENVRPEHKDRQIKLGPGGLRDVEMTIQLMQLVHGRYDKSVRRPHTLEAIQALATQGYIAREGAAKLARCYRFLRCVEHRAQLYRLRRTGLIPSADLQLRRIGRAIDGQKYPDADSLKVELAHVRHDVRNLHRELFFRPLLPATASLSADEAALSPEAAAARLKAVGYKDPQGSLRHIEALTAGVTRRAALQRQLLPVMIGWIANGANPDAGLLRFRRLSEIIGTSHWYLAMLRDSRVAAAYLAKLLPTSTYCAEGFEHFPAAVAWLDHPIELEPREEERLVGEMRASASRHEDIVEAAQLVREIRSRELLRAGLADCLQGVDPKRARLYICPADDAALETTLELAHRVVKNPRARIGIIALGRLGGREPGYASDADIMAVYEPLGEGAREEAEQTVATMKSLLSEVGVQRPFKVDLGLRPEGKDGPTARSIESLRSYYEKWASPWERQALLRARPVAGDRRILEQAMQIVDEYRYGRAPSEEDLRSIRMLKARMERERLPRGSDPRAHVKLGPGGLSDAEWAVQLIQLTYGHEIEQLRTTNTLQALAAAVQAGLLPAEKANALEAAWRAASRIRAANTLASGRDGGSKLDLLPRTNDEIAAVSLILGYERSARSLVDDYRRKARHCRDVMEEIFYG
ncbi:[glutamate--ammonia-ligase] adenylyltransferase [Winkia neuii]|uniref:bifunctional [glutamine synthetase] adenylyltransferase/[glutamine synthetase]-adenylyl-L-tyrosine phosphorylase n=1 Tax=Winkia neuii TaxID=33007 RepID=UPI000763CF35|nr:bifunctional [glutamine synthetase] adenylyltransferase/[glutamine synthetase]-adenylyl-L-tyrosine phosphorylase [Winkia neuii]KWZ72678.1 [glutamate--ammonia-ligase] adenylyltransferase [Winkia neuii]